MPRRKKKQGNRYPDFKVRKHTNNKGSKTIKEGGTFKSLGHICKRLGLSDCFTHQSSTTDKITEELED